MSRMRTIAVCFAALLAGCGGSVNETCNPFGGACPMGGTLQQCCSTSCRYVASDGTIFECNGNDCTSAVMMATQWCEAH